MTGLQPRFCPRCGTARVADMPFCPACGQSLVEFDEGAATGAVEQATAMDVTHGTSTVPAGASRSSSMGDWEGGRPSAALPTATGQSEDRGFRIPVAGIVALVAVVGLIVLLVRPQLPGSPGSGGQVAPGSGDPAGPGVAPDVPSAPIVGLTILSPTDGQAVASKDVTVIGLAPPGVMITQDVSFGIDQHATVDGTSHWAIKVGLNEGENKLTFRIGDDHSTQQTIRVTYTPMQTPSSS